MSAIAELLAFPIDRIDDVRLKAILRELAMAIQQTNDPHTLRALGQSLKAMGDAARCAAYLTTRDTW